jgi:hypothetical protein
MKSTSLARRMRVDVVSCYWIDFGFLERQTLKNLVIERIEISFSEKKFNRFLQLLVGCHLLLLTQR